MTTNGTGDQSDAESDNSPASGPNSWLVDEMYRQYLGNPRSVPEEWQEVFRDGAPGTGATEIPGADGQDTAWPAPNPGPSPSPSLMAPSILDQPSTRISPLSPLTPPASNGEGSTGPNAGWAPAPGALPPAPAAPDQRADAVAAAPAAQAPAPTPTPTPASPATTNGASPTQSADAASNGAPAAEKPVDPNDEPIRGVAARIAVNMEASLDVPTATSFREIPAKLLEVNRKVLNNHLRRIRAGKVSFTHLIGYAVVRAIAEDVPNLNNSYKKDENGKPILVRNPHINVGIAVDQQKSDGSRSLIVPVIKETENMSFAEFVDAYEQLIAKVRDNKIGVDDLMGATVSLTNPGTIGTLQSVPRLMPGQGAIIGVGSIGYPAEYQAADPKVLAQLGISKIIAITSTYDHRIIQGAESGLFLKKVHELLLGEDGFYDSLFADMAVPYEAVKWRIDHGASDAEDSLTGAVAKQMAVNTLINQYRVRGHLIANTDPLADRAPEMHPELDPATYGLTIWDLDREFLTGNQAGIYASIGGHA
ncbi:MAG: 2-oxo acid dehydrogenase subunit E2, partial [Acidimicrobiales bacterium]